MAGPAGPGRLWADGMAGGKRRPDLIGERDGQEPLLVSGLRPGSGVIRNRPCRMPPLSTSSSVSPAPGDPAASAARAARPAVTVPSCCMRAGWPIPATPYWKRQVCRDSSPVSCLLTSLMRSDVEPPAATACAAAPIPSR